MCDKNDDGIDVYAYIRRLKQIDCDDIECAHGLADMVLCDILIELELDEIVEEYRRIPKWYA